MYIALLGRQPELSIAELERVYGAVSWFSASTALVDDTKSATPTTAPHSAKPFIDVQRLGGTQKAGRVMLQIATSDWRRVSQEIISLYSQRWRDTDAKITLGISAYDIAVSPREVQKTGLLLKAKLKKSGVSVRLVPNQEAALSTATSHHNKLGLSDTKVELLVVGSGKHVIVAESTGAQNITALAARDQGRPRRDAFVGMLPPKLAQIMINLALPVNARLATTAAMEHLNQSASQPPAKTAARPDSKARLLDPFCGTGVLLQEAALLGHAVYGSDLSEKMIRYSQDNLAWLAQTPAAKHLKLDVKLEEGDAMTTRWQPPLGAVVSEIYLGQPFSAPPSPAKLTEVRKNCTYIAGTFLQNVSNQIKPGTPVVLAIPAWRSTDGSFTRLPLDKKLADCGFERIQLDTIQADHLMYYRPDQIVARELVLVTKK